MREFKGSHNRKEFKSKYKSYEDINRGRFLANFLSGKVVLEESYVLEIGCNTGAISLGLAEKTKFISCGDISKKAIDELNIKIKKRKLKNISATQLNALSLPYKENSFDIVILNGVLEWTPTSNKGNPRNIQVNILKEVKRVLKKKGLVYLAIENRYAMNYLLGKRDHSSLRFISFLPRWMADIYSRIVHKHSYREYLYTHRGYEQLLEEAGFNETEFYTGIPIYQYPSHIIKLTNKKEIGDAIEKDYKGIFRFGGKLLAKIGLYKYFGHNFIILAKKH